MPMSEEYLDQLSKEVKKNVISTFNKRALGSGVAEEYIEELKYKIR